MKISKRGYTIIQQIIAMNLNYLISKIQILCLYIIEVRACSRQAATAQRGFTGFHSSIHTYICVRVCIYIYRCAVQRRAIAVTRRSSIRLSASIYRAPVYIYTYVALDKSRGMIALFSPPQPKLWISVYSRGSLPALIDSLQDASIRGIDHFYLANCYWQSVSA